VALFGVGVAPLVTIPALASAPFTPARERTSMIEVTLDEGDRIEWALKAFKKKVQRSGLLKDLRRKRHYTKPSEARQLKAKAARRNRRDRGASR
jgi:small subunit ribosomal protein S21